MTVVITINFSLWLLVYTCIKNWISNSFASKCILDYLMIMNPNGYKQEILTFICMTQFLSNSLQDRMNVWKSGRGGGSLSGTILASISAKILWRGRGVRNPPPPLRPKVPTVLVWLQSSGNRQKCLKTTELEKMDGPEGVFRNFQRFQLCANVNNVLLANGLAYNAMHASSLSPR